MKEKAKEEYLEVEKKSVELRNGRHDRKVPRVCFYCGERDDVEGWQLTHQCASPQVIKVKDWEKPTRPLTVSFLEVEYYGVVYRFKDYNSALKFRRLLWIDEVPLIDVLTNKELKWYKDENEGRIKKW